MKNLKPVIDPHSRIVFYPSSEALKPMEERPSTGWRVLALALLTCCLVLGLTACGDTKGERALSGAGIGAGVGAVGSAVTGGSPWTGAAVGGVVGGATGALTNKNQINLDK